MSSRNHLVRNAMLEALRVRKQAGYALDGPVDVYDLLSRQGLELQFVEVPSLEGMYIASRSPQRVLISAQRPAGRQRLTAAHELGHHVFGHGTVMDLVNDDGASSSRTEELIANNFAYMLMMPRRAVLAGFSALEVDAHNPAPTDVYRVAAWLGTGQSTLLHQMRYTLELITEQQFKAISKTSAADARLQLGAPSQEGDLWPLAPHWHGQSAHMQLGDYVMGIPDGGHGTLLERHSQAVCIATGVGVESIQLDSGAEITLRASKREFRGFYDYRYLPEPQ